MPFSKCVRRATNTHLGYCSLLALLAVTPLRAQDDNKPVAPPIAWGTSDAPNALDIHTDAALGTITPSVVYTSAGYATGGVSLRNRGGGNIGISGVVTPVKAAYIYWAVITEGAATKADESIKLERLSPTTEAAVATITGKLLGTASSPCWAGNTISVFRGTAPTSVANGNGSYQVTLLPGAGGTTDGADPWLSYPLPLFEGASLVLAGKGTGTVAIYDVGLAGHTFASNPGLSYILKLPAAAPGNLAYFDNIGADGQSGSSRTAVQAVAEKTTKINGVAIAGPGSQYFSSDWSGNSASPLPQLWDDTGHTITSAVKKGTTALDLSFSTSGTYYDCLTTVANVVQVQ